MSLRLSKVSFFASALVALLAGHADAAITRKPYLQNVQQTAAVVMWESDQDGQGLVRFGTDEKMDRTAKAEPVKLELSQPRPAPAGAPAPTPNPLLVPPPTAFVFQARLDGLAPGSRVFYSVEQGGEKTPALAFQMMPSHAEKFRFVAYGDNRTQVAVHTTIAEQILKSKPDFVISTGDLVTSGPDYRQWTPQFFKPLENVMDHIPYWPCMGNHEGDGVNFRNLFNLPGEEVIFSFDYGNAHFCSIDSIAHTPDKIAEWLDRDLGASNAQWKFVYYHIPTYNAGGHRSAWGRSVLPAIYRKHHVDIVFTGHSHLYERTFPIRSSEGDPWPVLYVVTGGGGAPLYDLGEADFVAKDAKTHHIMVVDIDGNRLSTEVVDDKGDTIDKFTIDKSDGHTKEFLASAISEEQTNFSDALRLEALKPAPSGKSGEALPVAFTFANKELRGPAKITLRPEPGQFFQRVEPESISLTIEPGQEATAELKFVPALDLDKDNENYSSKLRELAAKAEAAVTAGARATRLAAARRSNSPIPLIRLKVEYETPLGKGEFTTSTLLAPVPIAPTPTPAPPTPAN